MYFTDDRYTDDCHFRGGLMRKYYDVTSYGNMMVAWNALPPYPGLVGRLGGSVAGAPRRKRALPARVVPPPGRLRLLGQRLRGARGRERALPRVPDRRLARRLPQPAAAAVLSGCAVRRRCWSGRGITARPTSPCPVRASTTCTRWCAGSTTGAAASENGVMDEPPVVVFMQEGEMPVVDRLDSAGTWRAETAWPAPGASERVLHLAADGALADEPGGDAADELRYDPTVGVTAGLWSGGIHFGLPGDQRPDEALSLTYTSPAARRGCARARTAARRAARDDLGARDRLLRQPRRRTSGRERRTSLRRACSTSRGGTRCASRRRSSRGNKPCSRSTSTRPAGSSAAATGYASPWPTPTGRTSGRRRSRRGAGPARRRGAFACRAPARPVDIKRNGADLPAVARGRRASCGRDGATHVAGLA